MAALQFTHPSMEQALNVNVAPNAIQWSYGLNVENFNTYGGEVIQILSAFIDDMTITGNVESYRQLEDIYSWFIIYAQVATVGFNGSGKFDVHPVQMYYNERGWHFQIYPTGAPGFKYGRDIVSPEWSLKASVVDPAQAVIDAIMDQAAIEAATNLTGEPALFGKATGEIGFEEHDPFSDPEGNTKANQEKFLGGQEVKQGVEQLADEYNKLLPAYLEGDFEDLTSSYSKPVAKAASEVEEKVKNPGGATQGQ
jgi:hypothetical protein